MHHMLSYEYQQVLEDQHIFVNVLGVHYMGFP